jgi:hypothetical protein
MLLAAVTVLRTECRSSRTSGSAGTRSSLSCRFDLAVSFLKNETAMKTMLDIPDDVVAEVQRRAKQHGRELSEQIVQLLKFALLAGYEAASGVPHDARLQTRSVAVHRVGHPGRSPLVSTDPATGLPVIHSPPEAPIRSMTAEQIRALVEEAQLEEDLGRAGLPIRH